MKKVILIGLFAATLSSCNDGGTGNGGSDSTKTNAAANDTIQTPDGVTNGSVISTNTEATRLDTTQKK